MWASVDVWVRGGWGRLRDGEERGEQASKSPPYPLDGMGLEVTASKFPLSSGRELLRITQEKTRGTVLRAGYYIKVSYLST